MSVIAEEEDVEKDQRKQIIKKKNRSRNKVKDEVEGKKKNKLIKY